MDPWIIIGALATILTASQLVPQVVKSIKTKKVRDISLWMIIIIISATIAWMLYGSHIKDAPIITANAIVFVSAISLLYLKLRHK